MTEKREVRYSDRTMRIGCAIVKLQRFVIVPSIFTLGWAVWTYSPNKLVALFILFFGTSIPLLMWATVFNILSHLAIKLQDEFQIDALCNFIKMASASFVVLLAKIIHGHEVHGEENLPKSSGALIVYYHPLLTYDIFLLTCKRYLESGKTLGGIAHRMLVNNMRGLCKFSEFYAERDRLIKDLKEGHVRSVAPGGGAEAAFSENYELVWNGRIGFAEVAKECGVPVLPMFTVNGQEATPVSTYGFLGLFKAVYDKTRLSLFFPLICLPVKLRTFIGEPIRCGDNESPAEFAKRVQSAIYELRDKHQRRPGSILLALLERFGYPSYTDELRQKKLN